MHYCQPEPLLWSIVGQVIHLHGAEAQLDIRFGQTAPDLGCNDLKACHCPKEVCGGITAGMLLKR